MIKQIKPNSLSHKFLSLIFEKHEIRHGINICDVPWRALKTLVFAIVITFLLTIAAGMAITYVVGVVLALLAPFFQYNLFFANVAAIGLVCTAALVVLAVGVGFTECSNGNIPLLPTYIKKATPKEPSPPSILSLWWASFKEKTCFKIVVDKLETEEEASYEEEQPESCVAIYRKEGESFVEVEDCTSAGYRIKYITSWLPHLLYDYMQEDQEIYLGVDDSEDKLLVSKWVIHCLMYWQEDNPDADFSIAAYNEWKKTLGEENETTL